MKKADPSPLVFTTALLLLATPLFTGCEAESVSLQNRYFDRAPLRVFPKENTTFHNTSFFIWKPNSPLATVQAVRKIGTEIDRLEEEKRLLNEREGKCAAAPECMKLYGELQATDAEISNPAPSSAPAPAPSSAPAPLLTAAEIHTRFLEKRSLQAKALELQVAGLAKSYSEGEKNYQDFIQHVGDFQSSVEYDERQPDPVKLTFDRNGTPDVKIFGWMGKTFQAKDGSIRDVRYVEEGGWLHFTAVIFADSAKTRVMQTYEFKMCRFHYDFSDRNGRKYFTGDIVLTIQPEFCTQKDPRLYDRDCIRSGIAKLVDQKDL